MKMKKVKKVQLEVEECREVVVRIVRRKSKEQQLEVA
jgi:hypothetical protein